MKLTDKTDVTGALILGALAIALVIIRLAA